MGNTYGNQKGGDITHLKEKISQTLNHLLSEHMDSFMDKTFCKKIKLFLRDDVLGGVADSDIKILGKHVLIGKEINDISEKKDICKKLSNYYLKKLNLISSVYFIINYTDKFLNKLENGPICYFNNKKDISKVHFKIDFEDKTGIINFNNKKIKIPNDNCIHLNEKELRKIAYNNYKKITKNNNIPNTVENFYLYSELSKSDCIDQKGEWMEDSKKLIEKNIIPSKDFNIKHHNRYFDKMIQKIRANTRKHIMIIIDLLNKIISEVEVTPNELSHNKDKKRFIEKPINLEDLNVVINKIKKEIEQIFIELYTGLFQVTSRENYSKIDLLKAGELKNKKKEIEQLILENNNKLSNSNI